VGNTNNNVKTQTNFNPTISGASDYAATSALAASQQPYSAPTANQAVAGPSANQQLATRSAAAGAALMPGQQATLGQNWGDASTRAKYMNPYESSVLDAQRAYAQKDLATQQAALGVKQGMNSAFGGDRGAVASSQLTQDYNLNSRAMEAKGLSSAYDTGMSQYNTDRTQALAGIRDEQGALSSTGSVDQQLAQSKDSYTTASALAKRDWSMTQAGKLATILSTTPKASSSSTDISGNTTLLQALGAASGLYNMLSGGKTAPNTAPGPGSPSSTSGTPQGGGDPNSVNPNITGDPNAGSMTVGNNGTDAWGQSSGNGGNALGTYTDPSTVDYSGGGG
jgi:hypothetical protein